MVLMIDNRDHRSGFLSLHVSFFVVSGGAVNGNYSWLCSVLW